MKREKVVKFLENSVLDFIISFLIIISLTILLLHKIVDFNVAIDNKLDIVDELFLIFFALEFLVKIIFIRKKYFIDDAGWIDLLAALPVLTPLIKYLLLSYSIDLFLVQETASITIVLRGLKFVRFFRVLRTTRLFIVFKNVNNSLKSKSSANKIPLTVPIIFSVFLLFIGYFCVISVENQLKAEREVRMEKLLTAMDSTNLKSYIDINPEILYLEKGNKRERRLSDRDRAKLYHPFEHAFVKDKNNKAMIIYSVKDILRASTKIEIMIFFIVLLYMIVIFIQHSIKMKQA